LTNLGSSNAQEITEVLYDQKDIVKWTVQIFTDLKYRSDICADENGPSLFLIPDHPVTKVFGKLKERGVEVRFITEITSKNLSHCKELMKIADLRHMDEIKGNFGIADGKIYGANALSFESQVPPRLITSNMTTFVDQQQYFFNMLWKKSIPAIDRMRELEEGIQRQIIETILDPAESLMLGLELLRSAKEEILIIFSSANAFFRQWKEGLLELLVELSKKEIDIKILTPLDERIEEIKQKSEKQEGYQQQQKKIYIRSLEQPLQVKMSTLLVDKKFSLTIELKDDSKDNSYDAIGLSTYSNSKSTVLSYVSIFQALWMQTALYEEVKASERIQKDFINIAAHELRNPIQPILGLSDILRYKIIDSEQLEILDVINRNAKRLQRLTEDILDITRIESQSLLLRIERFNIIDVIQNVVADSTKGVGNRKLKVDLLGSKEPIFIEADKGRITQVVTNILNNAIRFTSDMGGEIRISLEKKENSREVLLQVKDTGKGIDSEILPKLFSKFATKSIGGSGLGLYISKSIIEAHRGTIWAYNNSEGKGATFSITLPIAH
jgi:two-component system, OmpR family, sensor histidine kinase VicK